MTVNQDLPIQLLGNGTVQKLLGIRGQVPLTHEEMLEKLRVCFFPARELTPRLTAFLPKLRKGFQQLGIEVMDFEEALTRGQNGKVERGVVIVAAGAFTEGSLPIDYISSLSENIVVGIYDQPGPLREHRTQQAQIDMVLGTMGWDIVQVVIYLEQDTWTVCNMNGAIIPLANQEDISADIFSVLLSKLAAPVVPPRMNEFEVRPAAFEHSSDDCHAAVQDMVTSGPAWESSGLFVYQTALAHLKFRNKFYRRLGTAFVDHRSGMSYGFLVRQLPQKLEPALTEAEAAERFGSIDWSSGELHELGGMWHVCLHMCGERWVVPVPAVWTLGTRSGCSKTQLDPSRDIVRMGLARGQLMLELPAGLDNGADCKPSYDSRVIAAHALGNCLIASLLARLQPGGEFERNLRTTGLALAHWHGYLPPTKTPPGYAVHGEDNIPFACSTPQSAILTLQGKLSAFARHFEATRDYRGEIHVEPHHGTNMTGESLAALAACLMHL